MWRLPGAMPPLTACLFWPPYSKDCTIITEGRQASCQDKAMMGCGFPQKYFSCHLGLGIYLGKMNKLFRLEASQGRKKKKIHRAWVNSLVLCSNPHTASLWPRWDTELGSSGTGGFLAPNFSHTPNQGIMPTQVRCADMLDVVPDSYQGSMVYFRPLQIQVAQKEQ